MLKWALAIVALAAGVARAEQPDAKELTARVLELDAWGLAGGEVSARAIVNDGVRKRELVFQARSRRLDGHLTKSVIRFQAPADVAGYGFLQVPKKEGDDDRFLYMPELKRARRITSGNRNEAFMGTDFTYADLDRRDLRNSDSTIAGQEKLGKYQTWHLVVKPKGADPTYGRIEMWVRQDNSVPLRMKMYDDDGRLMKTLDTKELQRIEGRWFITRSLMKNFRDDSTTELLLEKVVPGEDVPDDEFTVRSLEKN